MADGVLIARTASGQRAGAMQAVLTQLMLARHTGATSASALVDRDGRWSVTAKDRDGRAVIDARGESGPLPAFENIPEPLRQAVFRRDGRVCAYCDRREGPMHIDHVVPRSRGGTDAMNNLAVACAPCNLSKGDKLVSEWRQV